jgi:DUF2993 family protein
VTAERAGLAVAWHPGTVAMYGQAPRRRRRRGRGALITLIVLLVLLVVAFLVADRVGHSIADQKAAQELAAQAQSNDIHLGKQPTVDITGFPFLTQVAAGKYGKVLVHLRDVTAEGYSIPTLDATATDVHAKAGDLMNGTGTITADRITGTAVLAYPFLAKTVKDQISTSDVEVTKLSLSSSGGNLRAHATVSAYGQQFGVVATVHLTLSGSTVQVKFGDLKATGGNLPSYLSSVLDSLASQMSTKVTLPALPYGLKFTGLQPASDGLAVQAAASDVSLAR